MARFYLHQGAFHELSDGLTLPDDAVEVPRLPVAGEAWDGAAFQLDSVLVVDLAASPAHVARAHEHKIIEALLIKSGVALSEGLLASEAVQRGLTDAAMADLVLAQAAPFFATEQQRMTDKITATASTGTTEL